VTATVINAETLAAAAQSGRDLWKEARECQYQVITLSPESLRSDEFKVLRQDGRFCARWGVIVVDEAHLVDKWGCDFRKSFADIWTLRSFAPNHITFVAFSASMELGRQTEQVLQSLGFRKGHYYFDKPDCEPHNVNLIFRDIKYTCTGHMFRDLDWLIPVDLTQASDLSKWLLISDTIEVGH
jgi:superfamily II DNA helicase RecQ